MSHNSDEVKAERDSRELSGEIPILLPLRYHPDAEGRCMESPTSDTAESSPTTSRQSRFSFGRRARGVVDSLLPEPLRPRYVNQWRPVRMDPQPASIANASTAAIYNTQLHPPRPSSSVYDDDDRWPDLTASSGSASRHGGSSSGITKSGHGEPHEIYAGNLISSKRLQAESTAARQKPERSPRSQLIQSARHPSASRHLSREELQGSNARDAIEVNESIEIAQHALERVNTKTDKQTDMYSQLAALRVPIRRRYLPCLPSEMKADDDENAPLLHSSTGTTSDTHIPFDPIDPYHRSGQPKKKVLYGPDGYLGKNKDWKQTSLQKVTDKVESLGNRVIRGIQRKAERDRTDDRMELLHGIVMKPSISINVDPEAQSEIYSKLELFLCTSANAYLLTQLQNNRFIGNDSIKRFVNYWKAKNRPVVPEFQFDLKTQREIILHNVRTFEFPGKYGLDPVLLKATLDAFGSVVIQLNVRTYCWPDSAIRKLFHDVHPILEMLGASKEIVTTFLDIKHLVVGLIHEAKYKKKMEELKRASSVRDSF